MKPFFADSSSAKMLTPEISYRYDLVHMRTFHPVEYELRKYSGFGKDATYEVIDIFKTKGGAMLAKSFAEFENGSFDYAVVARG